MNVKELKPHQALQCFLMCSVAYYHRFHSLIEDHEYDYLAKYLLENWYEWQDHIHAYLVTKDDLRAGTMYAIKYEDYPVRIRVATDMWSRDHYQKYGGL